MLDSFIWTLQSPWQDLVKIAISSAMSPFHERMGELTWNVGKSTNNDSLSCLLHLSKVWISDIQGGMGVWNSSGVRITLHAVGLGPRGQLTRTMSLRFLQFEMSRCGMASLVFFLNVSKQRSVWDRRGAMGEVCNGNLWSPFAIWYNLAVWHGRPELADMGHVSILFGPLEMSTFTSESHIKHGTLKDSHTTSLSCSDYYIIFSNLIFDTAGTRA